MRMLGIIKIVIGASSSIVAGMVMSTIGPIALLFSVAGGLLIGSGIYEVIEG